MIPSLGRLPEVPGLVKRKGYFVVYAPRQTGKTTAIRAIADTRTASGRYAALAFTCETARAAGDDYVRAQRGILGQIRREAVELKVRADGDADPLAECLAQLDGYLDRLGLDTGVLVLFDRRANAPPIAERTTFEQAASPAGRAITVLRA